MKNRINKRLIVVAYDISDDRRRSHVVKILEKTGTRINYSVFECMVTDKQFATLRTEILKCISPKEDSVVYYPICLDCYSQIIYQPERKRNFSIVKTV